MSRIAKMCVLLIAAVVVTAAFAFQAGAAVQVTEVSWQTVGTDVNFLIRLYNDDPVNPVGPVQGEAHAQPFGAFVPNIQPPLHTFDIPVLAPDSFFDVEYTVSLADLPPSAEKITPVGGGGALASAPLQGCPPNLFWAGNVDVFWTYPGGSGTVQAHYGTIEICPGGGPSYIHVVMDCPDPAGVSWGFSGVCPGWSTSLVLDDGFGMPNGPAPNPIPAGFFDGWICVSADSTVTVGSSCCFDLNLSCGPQPATVSVCADACIWEPVSTEESTWGRIKSLYRD